MDQRLATSQSASRLLFGPTATATSPFAIPLSTAAQAPSVASLPSASISVAARLPAFPSTLQQSLQQALAGSPSVHFASSPTSPISPTVATTTSAMASLNNSVATRSTHATLVPAAARPPRRGKPRRSSAAAAAAASLDSTEGDSVATDNLSSTTAQAPIRRSTRRKRPPKAQSTAAEDSKPPASKKRRGNLKKPPPGSIKPEDSNNKKSGDDEEQQEEPKVSCCICMDEPKPADLATINGCDHFFCFDCIEKWAERENTCPLCKIRFTKIERVNKTRKRQGAASSKNSKKVKRKDQRSDIPAGAALEGLLASFASSANFPPHRVARLIFSGMGGNPFMLPGTALRNRTAAASAAERAHALEDSLFSSDTDDDDDSSFLAGGMPVPPSVAGGGGTFNDFFRTGGFGVASRTPGMIVSGNPSLQGLSAMFVPNGAVPPHAAARSYASNDNDRNAGRQATNPLEIEDDSDDEEVEVVQVRRPTRATLSASHTRLR